MFVFDLVNLHHWTEIVGLGNSPFKDYSGWWNQIIYRIVSPPKRLKVICVFQRRVFLVEEKTNQFFSMCSWSEKINLMVVSDLFGLFVCFLFGCLVVCFFVFCLYYVHLCSIPSCERSPNSLMFFTEIEWLQYWIHILFIIQTGTLIFQSCLLAYPRFLCPVWWSESFP